MTVIVCLDDRDGMRFNGRRQSRDREVISHMLQDGDGILYVAPASAPLFPPDAPLVVREDFLTAAPDNGVCFAERPPLEPVADRITRLIIYRWNRLYPADEYLDLRPNHWTQMEQSEFPGSSHPRITREVYIP